MGFQTGHGYYSKENQYQISDVYIYRLLHKWGFSAKVPKKRFVRAESKEDKKEFKKRFKIS